MSRQEVAPANELNGITVLEKLLANVHVWWTFSQPGACLALLCSLSALFWLQPTPSSRGLFAGFIAITQRPQFSRPFSSASTPHLRRTGPLRDVAGSGPGSFTTPLLLPLRTLTFTHCAVSRRTRQNACETRKQIAGIGESSGDLVRRVAPSRHEVNSCNGDTSNLELMRGRADFYRWTG